jgi:hypothetical protein
MSDYVYIRKFKRRGCPECGGDHDGTSNYFNCSDCDFYYP